MFRIRSFYAMIIRKSLFRQPQLFDIVGTNCSYWSNCSLITKLNTINIVKNHVIAIASSVTYITPVVAVAAGIIFLNEKLTWNEPVGALIVLFGAAIAQERIQLSRV